MAGHRWQDRAPRIRLAFNGLSTKHIAILGQEVLPFEDGVVPLSPERIVLRRRSELMQLPSTRRRHAELALALHLVDEVRLDLTVIIQHQ